VRQDNDTAGRPDTQLWYVQGGITKNWTGLGNTVLYGEYARVDGGTICGAGDCTGFGGKANDVITSSQPNVWGIGVVQHIDAAAIELFLAYRRYRLRSPATSATSSAARSTSTTSTWCSAAPAIRFLIVSRSEATTALLREPPLGGSLVVAGLLWAECRQADATMDSLRA